MIAGSMENAQLDPPVKKIIGVDGDCFLIVAISVSRRGYDLPPELDFGVGGHCEVERKPVGNDYAGKCGS